MNEPKPMNDQRLEENADRARHIQWTWGSAPNADHINELCGIIDEAHIEVGRLRDELADFHELTAAASKSLEGKPSRLSLESAVKELERELAEAREAIRWADENGHSWNSPESWASQVGLDYHKFWRDSPAVRAAQENTDGN